MVTLDLRSQNVLDALKRWYDSLPPGIASWRTSDDRYERVVTIAPSNPLAAEVIFRFSSYGTFGVYFGPGSAGEDVPVSADFALEVCEAVRRGQLTERVRSFWRWRTTMRTRLQLKNRQLEDRLITPLALLPIGKVDEVAYEAWEHGRSPTTSNGATGTDTC